MTHRRLILATCVAVVALGAAWWWFADELSAEEQRLVGTWRQRYAPDPRWPNGAIVVWSVGARHTCTVRGFDPVTGAEVRPLIQGYWNLQNDRVALVWEEGFIDRFRQLLPAVMPGSRRGAFTERLRIRSISAYEVNVTSRKGNDISWARDPGD